MNLYECAYCGKDASEGGRIIDKQIVCVDCGNRIEEKTSYLCSNNELTNKPDGNIFCQVTGMEFVKVPGGSFDMGDVWGDGVDSELPVHHVTIKSFILSKYPVTQDQWEKIMLCNPSYLKGAKRPVEQVSWDDAQEFIVRLNRQSSRTYRLPTEAEWEYAARACGENDKWSGTSDKNQINAFVIYMINQSGYTREVLDKHPNRIGLCHMSGLIWEWCQDLWHDDYYGAPSDGTAWISGNDSARIIRGGSWGQDYWDCRTATRNAMDGNTRDAYTGFRIAMTI